MEPYRKPSNLRIAKYYIINALKFYELKNEKLTPFIFVILLFTGLIGGFFAEAAAKVENTYLYTFLNFTIVLILNIASTIYLHSYITELKGGIASLRKSLKLVLRNLHKILLAYLAFIAIIMAGVFLLILPAFIFYHMFMFNLCYLVDKDIRVRDAFNASRNITTGNKMEIFAIFIMFNLMIFFPLFLVILISSTTGSSLILSFVITFFSSILTLMNQRLIALLYLDLEYGRIKN
jgi:uncharacterized membrane protein